MCMYVFDICVRVVYHSVIYGIFYTHFIYRTQYTHLIYYTTYPLLTCLYISHHPLSYTLLYTLHTQATKQLTISRAPAVLVLHLKRFTHQGQFNMKINKHIDFTMSIQLACTDEKPVRIVIYS